MASQAAAKNVQEPDLEEPSGFVDGGTPDIDGWYKAEKNRLIYGKIVGHMRINGENGLRDVICVKLRKPCIGFQQGDDKGAELPAGSVLGVTVSADLKDALDYVEKQGEIWAYPQEKKKLKGGRTIWKYRQKYKGVKAPLMASSAPSSSTGDDDDIPF